MAQPNRRANVAKAPNDNRYMDQELVEMLEQSVNSVLGIE